LKGKIVLISFPFTDLTATKLRPALILYESEKDVVAAFISSKSKNPKTDFNLFKKDILTTLRLIKRGILLGT